MLKQDLHIHTIFSRHDRAIVPEQTIELISRVRHARIIGISDHYEAICDQYSAYREAVRKAGFHLGTEVDGNRSAKGAARLDVAYYFYHCRDTDADYKGIETLLATGKPVIISHPNATGTDLNRVPPECLVEINNRYVWRHDWRKDFQPFIQKFRFVASSDAHQPNWLNQSVAQYVMQELGLVETILF